MTKVAIEHTFTGPTGAYASGYDSTKTMLGQLIRQQTGSNSTDKYAGPLPVGVMRPFEGGAINPNIGTMNVCAIDAGNNIHWVFEIENSSAATVIRKIMLSTFNTSTGVWNIKGTITVTAPSTGTMPIRGFAVQRHLYTTGTVIASTNSTTVTGTGTAWFSARYAEGARIGFGSTDPNDIKTWYYIATGGITTDTSLTLTSVLQTAVPPNSPYVIDELRLYWAANGATTICGIYAVKGVTYDDFTPASTAIPAATSTDNNKACYWLVDNASTQLNTQPQGIALSSTVSDTSQYMWVIDGSTTTWRLYKYDVRAALTVSSGKSVSSFVFRGSGMTSNTSLNGTVNSICCATPNHGPGAGLESLYIVSAQNGQCRIVRLNANTVDASAAVSKYLLDTMQDVTPYPVGVGLLASSGAISVRYMASIDRFIVSNGYRFSIAKYNVDGYPIERIFNFDYKSSDQVGSVVPPYPANSTSPFVATIACCNGILYVCRQSTTAGSPTYQSQTYAVPIGADWDYAAGISSTYQNRLITPELSTPTCRRFYRLMVNNGVYLGTASLGLPPEPYRAYYRTGGISDNSGAWNLVQENGDLTGVGSSPSIQFMFEFRVAGAFMLSPKIYGLTCIYEDESTDNHYQPSLNFTNKTTKIFAWRFANAFGGTVPKLYVKIYESATGTLLIKDDTVNQSYGTFQKSTDGGYTWGSYNTTDKNNNTTYIRYTPTLLADNLKVRMVLTQ